jgi:hypothetical protein
VLRDPSLNEFTTYAGTTPSGRGPLVHRMLNGGAYNPAQDFYRGLRPAVMNDRRTTRDGAAVEAAVTNAHEKKRARYARLAEKWSALIPRWSDSNPIQVDRTRLLVGGLSIKVPAPIVEQHPDGAIELAYVYFKEQSPIPAVTDMIRGVRDPAKMEEAARELEAGREEIRRRLGQTHLAESLTWSSCRARGPRPVPSPRCWVGSSARPSRFTETTLSGS